MNENIDLDKEFEIYRVIEFLDKNNVQLSTEVKIFDVKKGGNSNRPLFYGQFPFGERKFDLCVAEMQKILDHWGNFPRSWIGKTATIKANPYRDGKKEGLRLTIEPR